MGKGETICGKGSTQSDGHQRLYVDVVNKAAHSFVDVAEVSRTQFLVAKRSLELVCKT